jgi:hypothetical protein
MFDLPIHETDWPAYPVDQLRNSSDDGCPSPSVPITDRCSGRSAGPRRAEPLSAAQKASVITGDPFALGGDQTHIQGLTGSRSEGSDPSPQPRRKATRDPQKETAPIPARMAPHEVAKQ